MAAILHFNVEIHVELPRFHDENAADEYMDKLTGDIDRRLADLDLDGHGVEYIDVMEVGVAFYNKS